MVGVYNCTWSAAAAFACFTGGTLYDRLGRGAVFWLPAVLFAGQFAVLTWLSRQAAVRDETATATAAATPESAPAPAAPPRRINARGFLRMAWLANPFAYVAMNTLLAVMPGIAEKLALSPTRVGLYCSIWFFGRFAAFAVLWQWTGWHYRFRWLLAAYVTLVVTFAALLLTGQLWVFVVTQVFFGLAAGLIYYSSLFYSMDVGEASAEHGGLHEAAIGAGIFAGPAVGAISLQYLSRSANSGVVAVSSLLTLGLVGLVYIWQSQRRLKL
jgi:predicted MFS family arabinose efflux permease